MSLAQNENRYFCDALKSVLSSDLSHFVISMVMLREGLWGDCCTIFHQYTELSHTYHISLFLFPSVLSLSPTNARSSSQLFLHVSSAHSSIPLAFMFAFIPTSLSLLLGELHTVSFPLCRVHLLLSCLPFLSSSPLSPFLSGCVFFYLTLLFCRGFMPFTWEPFYPFLRALSSAVPT